MKKIKKLLLLTSFVILLTASGNNPIFIPLDLPYEA